MSSMSPNGAFSDWVRITIRLRGEAKTKPGSDVRMKDEYEAQIALETHETFLAWYLEFLQEQLIPTASYQRHITGLKSMVTVLKLGRQEIGSTEEALDTEIVERIASNASWIRLVCDLIMDPFDDVREAAVGLLAMLPLETVGASRVTDVSRATLLENLKEFTARAEALATKTGRADYGNGVARSQELALHLVRYHSPRRSRFLPTVYNA